MTLGQIVHTLDKEIVLEQVLPVIVKIPSREPGVLMGILGTLSYKYSQTAVIYHLNAEHYYQGQSAFIQVLYNGGFSWVQKFEFL